MAREGNLEAPTRHPIDWKEPGLLQRRATFKEMERIFDICHGCRRCVSLCGSFPTLFDLVDESKTDGGRWRRQEGLLEGGRPVLPVRPVLHDQVPLRAAARVEPGLPAHHAAGQGDQVQKGRGRLRREAAGLHRCAWLVWPAFPSWCRRSMRSTRPPRAQRDGIGWAWTRTPGCPRWRRKVPLGRPKAKPPGGERRREDAGQGGDLSTCYINYNEPGIGLDLLKVLDHNDVPYVLVDKEKCCGMPKLELGDLESVNASKEANIPVLARYAKEGYAISAPCPAAR
jgi:glycerol-3-phosphate dehydrogenase subunit C